MCGWIHKRFGISYVANIDIQILYNITLLYLYDNYIVLFLSIFRLMFDTQVE